jgi:hypothetical protein
VEELLPLIRRWRPGATFAMVGRTPPPAIVALAKDAGITVTGTVPDVRPLVLGISGVGSAIAGRWRNAA